MGLPEEQYFEQILDRRLGDFEKVVETRLTSIQEGVTRMQESITVFVSKVSNMHEDYPTRREYEKDQETVKEDIKTLKKKVEKLEAWRNYLAGAVGIMVIVIGWVINSHFWK